MADDNKKSAEAARTASAEALAASTRANEIFLRMEAPYVTGGGSYWRDIRTNSYIVNLNGDRRFRVDVSNYGKTPAFLVAFDVQFATKAEVKAKLLPVSHKYAHYDLLPPGGVHQKRD